MEPVTDMGYYDTEDNVREYIEMASGYDGAALIKVLRKHLHEGASVLELGMGPGKDLDLLSESFKATGSDASTKFLDLYAKRNKHADLLLLEATTIDTERKFDCIYSNKVLIHLSKSEMRASVERQAEVLNSRGVLLHSFWYGDKEEEHHGLRFVYYTEPDLMDLATDKYELVELERYTEMEERDSIYILMKRFD